MQKIDHKSIHQSRNNNSYIINHLQVAPSKPYHLKIGASMVYYGGGQRGQLQSRRIFAEAVCISDWISGLKFWRIMPPSEKLNRALFGVFQFFRSELCRRQCNSWRIVHKFRQKGNFYLNFRQAWLTVGKPTATSRLLIWDSDF